MAKEVHAWLQRPARDVRWVYRQSLEEISALQAKHTVLPTAPPTTTHTSAYPHAFLLTNNHFVNYAGGYYSYLYAQCWAAQIWTKRFQPHPLSRYIHSPLSVTA